MWTLYLPQQSFTWSAEKFKVIISSHIAQNLKIWTKYCIPVTQRAINCNRDPTQRCRIYMYVKVDLFMNESTSTSSRFLVRVCHRQLILNQIYLKPNPMNHCGPICPLEAQTVPCVESIQKSEFNLRIREYLTMLEHSS